MLAQKGKKVPPGHRTSAIVKPCFRMKICVDEKRSACEFNYCLFIISLYLIYDIWALNILMLTYVFCLLGCKLYQVASFVSGPFGLRRHSKWIWFWELRETMWPLLQLNCNIGIVHIVELYILHRPYFVLTSCLWNFTKLTLHCI